MLSAHLGENMDFLKVLCFSFLVPVVDPSAKDFNPLQRANLQEEFSYVGFSQSQTVFPGAPSIGPNHTTFHVTSAVTIQIQLRR